MAIGMPGRMAFRIAGGAAFVEGRGARFLADGVEFFLRRVFQRRSQLFLVQLAVRINCRSSSGSGSGSSSLRAATTLGRSSPNEVISQRW